MIFGESFDGGIKGAGGASPPMRHHDRGAVLDFRRLPDFLQLIFLSFAFGAWGFGGKMVFLQTLQFNNGDARAGWRGRCSYSWGS